MIRLNGTAKTIVLLLIVVGFFALTTSGVFAAGTGTDTGTNESQELIGKMLDAPLAPFDPSNKDSLFNAVWNSISGDVFALFIVLTAIEFVYTLAVMLLQGGPQVGTGEFYVKMLGIAISFGLIKNAGWIITNVYTYVGYTLPEQFGATAAKSFPSAIQMATTNIGSPGAILETCVNLAFALLLGGGQGVQGWGAVIAALQSPAYAVFAIPCFFLIILAGIAPAVKLGLTWIKFTIAAYGLILLGFFGSRVTKGIAQPLMHLYVTLAVQTLAITGYVSMMIALVKYVIKEINASQTGYSSILSSMWSAASTGDLGGVGTALTNAVVSPIEAWVGGALAITVFSVMSLFVDKIAESWITGTPSMSFGDALKTMATVAAAAIMPAAGLAGAATASGMLGGAGGAAGGAMGGGNAIGGAAANLPGGGGGGSGAGGAGGGGGFGPFSGETVRSAAVVSAVGKEAVSTLRDIASHFEPARGSSHLNV